MDTDAQSPSIVDWISETFFGTPTPFSADSSSESEDDTDPAERARLAKIPPWGQVEESELESPINCRKLLRRLLPQAAQGLQCADRLSEAFNRNFDLWDGEYPNNEERLTYWRDEILSCTEKVVRKLLESGKRIARVNRNAAWREQLQTMVDGYILELVHDKLMVGVERLCEDDDDELDRRMEKLHHIDAKVVGVRKEHRDMIVGEALTRFRQLPRLVTPLEKVLTTPCHSFGK
ncbi:hypothetical protein CYMTET_32383, partial [Cymbomonas tetramitiformis]